MSSDDSCGVNTSFFVQVCTGQDYTPALYKAAADQLLHICEATLCDRGTLSDMLDGKVSTCTVSIEIGLRDQDPEPRELQANCVIDLNAEKKLKLDKGKLTKLIKSLPEMEEWLSTCRILKKAVP